MERTFFIISLLCILLCSTVVSQNIPPIHKDSISLYRKTAKFLIENDECEKGMKLYQILALNYDTKSALALHDIYNSGQCGYIDKYEANKWRQLFEYMRQSSQQIISGDDLAKKFGIDIGKINQIYSEVMQTQTVVHPTTSQRLINSSDTLKAIISAMKLQESNIKTGGGLIVTGVKLQKTGIAIGISSAVVGGISVGIGAARSRYNSEALKTGGIVGGVISGVGALISLICEIVGLNKIEQGGVSLQNSNITIHF